MSRSKGRPVSAAVGNPLVVVVFSLIRQAIRECQVRNWDRGDALVDLLRVVRIDGEPGAFREDVEARSLDRLKYEGVIYAPRPDRAGRVSANQVYPVASQGTDVVGQAMYGQIIVQRERAVEVRIPALSGVAIPGDVLEIDNLRLRQVRATAPGCAQR